MARTVNLSTTKFQKKMKRLAKYVKRRWPHEVFDAFVEQTPKGKTKNARNKTKMKRVAQGYKIVGDYPYSGVIDQGLYPKTPKNGAGKTRNGYSTQAPEGIVDPTAKEAKEIFERYARRMI